MGDKVMARIYFRQSRPDYLTATCVREPDRAIVRAFKAKAAAQGLSVQRALLEACQEYLESYQ
ncbi:hypothetical protein SynBIOSE41_01988 [Synechococcus sp. BIOS-E4-1]|nr:hypothetical protein SynBIOSE41_01988 [Synechococcus sp. BIOS-E4-1]